MSLVGGMFGTTIAAQVGTVLVRREFIDAPHSLGTSNCRDPVPGDPA
jgi:hypothetical protein